MDDRSKGLLSWQRKHYPANHRERRNLLLHIVTVPLFQLGTLMLATAPLSSLWLALPGLLFMVGAVALQGRGHRLETVAPIPFRGPLDVVSRIFVEQWVTFPRFVLAGGFTRAWRAATSGAGVSHEG
jgi:hypothetical protein